MRCLLVDNWLLQDVSTVLVTGASKGDREILAVTDDRSAHSWSKASRALYEIDALICLLSEVPFTDVFLFDTRWKNAWAGQLPGLDQLIDENLVSHCELLDERDGNNARSELMQTLCCLGSLADEWSKARAAIYPKAPEAHWQFSQIIWGTSGYLACSAGTGHPYLPHPARGDAIRALFTNPNSVPVRATEAVLESKRLKIWKQTMQHGHATISTVLLPAAAIKIIQESHTRTDLVNVACQIRADWSALREWIDGLEKALRGDLSLREASRLADDLADASLAVTGESENLGEITIAETPGLRVKPSGHLFRRIWQLVNRHLRPKSSQAQLFKLLAEHPQGRTAIKKLVDMTVEDPNLQQMVFHQLMLRYAR